MRGEPLGTPVNMLLWVAEEEGEPEDYPLPPLREETAAIVTLTPQGGGNSDSDGDEAQCLVSQQLFRLRLRMQSPVTTCLSPLSAPACSLSPLQICTNLPSFR
jgi:hypothetical protein